MTIPQESVHSIITEASTNVSQALSVDFWQDCLGLLKHGGHAIVICCRLITPPNGIVLDPFPNAQTQIEKAAKAEGFSYKRG